MNPKPSKNSKSKRSQSYNPVSVSSHPFSITMNVGLGRTITKTFKTAEELYEYCVVRRPDWFRFDVAKLEKEWVNKAK